MLYISMLLPSNIDHFCRKRQRCNTANGNEPLADSMPKEGWQAAGKVNWSRCKPHCPGEDWEGAWGVGQNDKTHLIGEGFWGKGNKGTSVKQMVSYNELKCLGAWAHSAYSIAEPRKVRKTSLPDTRDICTTRKGEEVGQREPWGWAKGVAEPHC